MSDLEQRLREMLEAQAGSVPAVTSAPPELVRRVRRRQAWRATVTVTLAVVLLVGGGRLLLAESDGETSVAAQPPSTTAPAPSLDSPTANATLSAEMFVDGRLVRFSAAPVDLGALPLTNAPTDPPVRTPFGVLAALGRTGLSEVWLAPDGGAPVRIATGVSGLAVAADGTTIAWAENTFSGGAYSSVAVVARLPDGRRVHSVHMPSSARVEGFVGELVLLTRGDGAGGRASIWMPSSRQVVDIPDFRTVADTDPSRSIAVLNEGDGICAAMFIIDRDGTVRHDPPLRPCRRALALSPNGERLAAASTGDSPEEFVIVTGGGQQLTRSTLTGRIVQAVWRNDDEVLVLSGVSSGAGAERYSVWLCRVDGGCEPAWDVASKNQPDAHGSVWILGP